jgi:hypothetical protein
MSRSLFFILSKPDRLDRVSPQYPVSANVSNIGTLSSEALSADGMTWSQAFPIVADQYGKVIVNVQTIRTGNQRNVFLFKNSDTWVENTAINDLGDIGEIGTRWMLIYDISNDCFHGYLYYNAEVAVYRRYEITRDGSNNITAITWTRGSSPNVVLIDTATSMAHPILLEHNGELVAILSISNSTNAQIIAMRVAVADAGTASNWTNIGFNSAGALATISAASYSVLASQVGNSDLDPSAIILSDGSIFLVYARNSAYYYRRVQYNGSSWNSLGAETLLFNIAISGTDTGYNLKRQLISKIIQIDTDVYFALPVWGSNVLGDTVRIVKVTSDGNVSTVDVYSANGIHSYAPTLDLSQDNGRLLVSYLKTNNGGTFVRMYDTNLVALSDEFLIYNTGDSDIPLLSSERINNKTLCVFRLAGTPPQDGIQAEITYG